MLTNDNDTPAGIATDSAEIGAEAVRRLLNAPGVEAVEMPRPPLNQLPFRPLVEALLRGPGFKVDFHGQAPDAVLAMVTERLFGPRAFGVERALLAHEISRLSDFGRNLVGGGDPLVAIRTYFAPGDLVWHVDRLNERSAVRLIWALGRPAGMRVTPADNIDHRRYSAYMRREYPLLGQLDTQVLRTGASVEALWAHRPVQVAAMTSGRFPFVLEPEKEWEIHPAAVSVHRVETPGGPGTYHRSSWANRNSPGLQIVITAAFD